ncbi:MAG TPA: M17 family peptidase N-terminal domain-containing protein [Polyangiaceae bacterium]
MIEQLHFVEADLRALDGASGELIACSVFADERPMRGLAGLLDWRLAGKLSALAKSKFLTGAADEVVLVPGRPRLPFEKIIVLGLGVRSAFGDDVVKRVLARLAQALEGLQVKRALVELPGRGSGSLEPERAAELLLECAEPALEDEMWTLVDEAAAEETMAKKLLRRRDARPRSGA